MFSWGLILFRTTAGPLKIISCLYVICSLEQPFYWAGGRNLKDGYLQMRANKTACMVDNILFVIEFIQPFKVTLHMKRTSSATFQVFTRTNTETMCCY